MSSVPGLAASPRKPMRLSLITHRARCIFSRKRSMRCWLMSSASLRIPKSIPIRPAKRQSARMSRGKRRPPKPSPARVQELRTDSPVEPKRLRHLLHIAADPFAEVADHVRV
jgi:hypothetical protein